MGIISLLFSLFGVFLENSIEKKKFYIDDKWTIELPTDWDRRFSEIEINNSTILENIFFLPNTDLSMRIYSLNILKDDNYKKMEADIPDILAVFENIMSKVENKKEYRIPNHKSSKFKCYEYSYYENDKEIYAIATGIFMKGYLLKVNIASTIKKEVEKAIYYLFSINKVDPKEMEFLKKINSCKE
ncbi:hypothetical protein C7Y58_07820 [Fusobacterium nucleatum subsp. nucleatum ATCC 25586]|uniref:Uncharacterized protein n=1 Tax=Fusobacterium nucleatum subsp. nucleatum (strain ATCC 25586 / DSM 15643 / BCRC 10681 / CIP 101130 / JCM 8532 / KCTC 2640 / LMG 13131 / VPI 4355) TaxID=190304 RepID=A0ABM6TQW4_FUSNN|nr:hypothetical protein [Fusobacterium nucleatum]AVQ15322.1 hypothetical protein C7Y58_07820 [Fusobacterium nucleatum subsp. nucleatum ATCC 25586]MCG6841872.1 hypothetical protein [Fusobacterium nucleatum]WMS30242.1 hypothetical protein RDV57_04045 [Fusobacterium nucleatum]